MEIQMDKKAVLTEAQIQKLEEAIENNPKLVQKLQEAKVTHTFATAEEFDAWMNENG
jgi:hypothetical protein